MSPFDVAVVGSANADLLVAVERRPGAGETVLGSDLRTLPGGKGANQAVAAALLGATVCFVGCLGEDAHGTVLRDSLREAGVDLSGTRTVATPTGVALILVDEGGDNSIVVSPGANAQVRPNDVTTEAVAQARVLILQREIDPGVSLAAARHAQGLVVLNLAPSGPVPAGLLARTDVLVVNEHEAGDLLVTGPISEPAKAGSRLREAGPSSVVITLGARGAVAVDANGTHIAAPPKVVPVDTTGAGDAFTGALAWRLSAGDTLADALGVAVRVGALAVTRPGAQPSFPTRTELDASTRG